MDSMVHKIFYCKNCDLRWPTLVSEACTCIRCEYCMVESAVLLKEYAEEGPLDKSEE